MDHGTCKLKKHLYTDEELKNIGPTSESALPAKQKESKKGGRPQDKKWTGRKLIKSSFNRLLPHFIYCPSIFHLGVFRPFYFLFASQVDSLMLGLFVWISDDIQHPNHLWSDGFRPYKIWTSPVFWSPLFLLYEI